MGTALVDLSFSVLYFLLPRCPLNLSFPVVFIFSLSGVLETLCDAYAVLLRQQVPGIIRQAINGYLQVGEILFLG